MVSFMSFLGMFLLLPGLISVLENWWPVPRVLSHVGLFASLLIFASVSYTKNKKWGGNFQVVAGALVLLTTASSILSSNQIFSDQATVNRLDRNLAERIVIRLENTTSYEDSMSLAIVGRFYSYPVGVRTMQGDLNISAFWTTPYKLIEYVSGKPVVPAVGLSLEDAISECKNMDIFPAPSSVFIKNDVAVVCLK